MGGVEDRGILRLPAQPFTPTNLGAPLEQMASHRQFSMQLPFKTTEMLFKDASPHLFQQQWEGVDDRAFSGGNGMVWVQEEGGAGDVCVGAAEGSGGPAGGV